MINVSIVTVSLKCVTSYHTLIQVSAAAESHSNCSYIQNKNAFKRAEKNHNSMQPTTTLTEDYCKHKAIQQTSLSRL